MSTPANETVVTVGNNTENVNAEVLATLEGLAFVTGALLKAGRTDVIPQDHHGLASFDHLMNAFNDGLADQATSDQLRNIYPDISERLTSLQTGLGSQAFKWYVWNLGCLDTMYSLKPKDEAKPHELALTVIGFD